MRIAVVGCGSIGSRHARNVIALGHRVMLCDTNKELAADLMDELGDSADMTAFQVYAAQCSDAVMICTPASTHATGARQLLAAGYVGPLFCEKPLALSVDECEVFTAWPNVCTMVGYNLRFHEQVKALRLLNPTSVSGGFHLYCDARSWPGGSYASMILECSHELDLALSFGAPAMVDTVLRWSDDRAAFWLGNDRKWIVDLYDRSPVYLRQWILDKGPVVAFQSPEELGGQMYVDELAHFLDCAQRGVPTEVPFADGIRVLDVIAQAKAMAAVHG